MQQNELFLSVKHLNDVKGMMAASAEAIDRNTLSGWIERGGLEREWAAAQELER